MGVALGVHGSARCASEVGLSLALSVSVMIFGRILRCYLENQEAPEFLRTPFWKRVNDGVLQMRNLVFGGGVEERKGEGETQAARRKSP